jgi:hypothetical protein
MWGSW